MKRQELERQSESIGSLDQIVHNQKFLNIQNYERVKNQIKNLHFQLPCDKFKIIVVEETKVRIVLRITYFLSFSQFTDQCRDTQPIGKNNKTTRRQSQMHLNLPMLSESEKKNNSQSSLKDQDHKLHQNFVIFTCIIDYDVYPFTPPYLFITADIGLPKALSNNDFRNISEDILEEVEWFPIYGLYDIFIKIPTFISKLTKSNDQTKSNYYYSKPFKKSDIQLYAQGLKLYQGQFYDTKDAFIGKYVRRTIGISFKSLIIFKSDNKNELTISYLYELQDIETVKVEQNAKRVKFLLKLSNKKQIKYKFVRNEADNKLKQVKPEEGFRQEYDFIQWMKICLLNAEMERIGKDKSCILSQNQSNSIEFEQRKSKKIFNLQKVQSDSTFLTIGKKTIKRETSARLQPSQFLIVKQQLLSRILECLDLLLSSPIYQQFEEEDIEIYQVHFNSKDKTKNYNIKGNINGNNSTLMRNQDQKIDLLRLQYLKLNQYKKQIETERKMLFIQL